MRIDDTQQSVQVLADSTMTVGRVAELVAESFGTGDRIVSCVMLENGARLPRTDPVLRHLSPGQYVLCCQLAPPAPAVPPVPAVPQIGDGELLERQMQAYLTAGRLTARDGVRPEVINTTVGFAVLAFGKGAHPLYWCCVVCFSAPFISALPQRVPSEILRVAHPRTLCARCPSAHTLLWHVTGENTARYGVSSTNERSSIGERSAADIVNALTAHAQTKDRLLAFHADHYLSSIDNDTGTGISVIV